MLILSQNKLSLLDITGRDIEVNEFTNIYQIVINDGITRKPIGFYDTSHDAKKVLRMICSAYRSHNNIFEMPKSEVISKE